MSRLSRTAALISGATFLSRLLGLVREQVFALLLGASALADAFQVGFRIPNLLRDLFAEGALSQAFVPTFKKELKDRGEAAAHALADRVASTLAVVLALAVAAGLLAAPAIVSAMAGGFREVPGKFDLAVACTRVMLPFLPLISLAAVAMGTLNARERYGAPALAPAAFNVATLIVAAILWAAGVSGPALAIGWSLGTLAGGLAQLVIQLPPLWRGGYRPRLRVDLRLRDPAVRRVAALVAPAIVGLAATQVNLFVNTAFAASEPGAVSWLNYAFRFLQLPIGLFGVAIGVVSATRFADAAADRDDARLRAQMTESLRLLAFLTVPATVGLWVLAAPIVRLIYERGAFGAADTAATALALRAYTLGLLGYAAVKVVAPAFYARGSARAPLVASLLAVAANFAWNAALHRRWGFAALALGTSVAATVNFAVLIGAFWARVGIAGGRGLAVTLAKIAAASAACGAAAHLTYRALAPHTDAGATAAAIAAGAVVYAGGCFALRVEELRSFRRR